jgi:hypothetical protein
VTALPLRYVKFCSEGLGPQLRAFVMSGLGVSLASVDFHFIKAQWRNQRFNYFPTLRFNEAKEIHL